MPGKNPNILLVEDNPGDARLVREMLAEARGESFAVTWVPSLSEALAHLDRGGIDLVILDLGLPDSQGLDTFLHAYEHGSHLPFLVLTGYADETLGSTAVQQGAQDYLPKGEVTSSILCRAIRYAIERKQAEEELVKKTHDLGERVKELHCLYNMANLLAQPNISQDEIIQGVLELIPPAWHYPDNTCARITFKGRTFRTSNFRETEWRQDNDILVNGDRVGCVEVFYLESRPTLDEGPFLKEERSLLDSIAKALGGTIERKQAEEMLAAEHQKLFSLLDELPVFVYLKAPDFSIRFANRVFRNTFGPWEGKRCFKVVLGKEAPCKDCPSFTVLKTNTQHQWEWTTPDGTRTYQVHNYPFADTDGSPLVLTLGIDITERKRTEEALRIGEESYRQLFEQAGDALILHDRGRIVEANQEACRSLGYTREELVHKSVFDIEEGLDPESLSDLWEQPDRGVVTLSGLHRRKNGAVFPVQIRSGEVMYYGKKLRLAAVRDVTEQQRSLHEIQKLMVDLQTYQVELEQQNEELRRAQAEIEASQARYANLYDFAPMGYFTFDVKGMVVEANLTGAEMLHLERQWLLGSAFLRWVAPESHPAFHAHVRAVFNSGAHQTCELDLVPPGNTPFPATLESAPVLAGDKKVRYCRTTVTDITKRKQAEEALRESEERFRAIFNQAAVGVAQIETRTGRFIWVNQKYCDIVGLKPEEMTATTFMAITHPDDLQADLDNMQRLREGLIRNFSMEKRYVRRDGSLFWVNLTVSPMWDIGQPPNYHIAVVEDITERKQAEEDLQSSERKLRLLAGQLLTAQEDERKRISGELHDELGHALLTLKLDLRSIEKQLLPGQQALSEEVESILKYVDTVIKNVRRLYLGLSPGDLEDLGVTAALMSLIDEFSQHHPEITWSIDLENIDGLFPLEFQTNIYRIFQETFTNIGKHAAPTRVSIVIRKTNKKILFEVNDNGPGFNYNQLLDASYEKGMGLIVMDERVRIMGGSFNVRSQENQGTKITFTIPVH